jgi:hypothetical protein
MIIVDMQLQSAISPDRDRTLGRVLIINDGEPTDARLHNYRVEAISTVGRVFRRGNVRDWPRDSRSPLQLLTAALKALGYD